MVKTELPMHGGTGLILNRETKIPHVTQHGQKKKKKHQGMCESVSGALFCYFGIFLGHQHHTTLMTTTL